jgi:PAS domain S-box-containing protein
MGSSDFTGPDAERRITAARERQWHQFEQAPGFICIHDGPDHIYQFANEAYRRLVGQRELIGRSVRDAMPDIYGQGFYERLDAVYATGERFRADAVAVSMARTPGGPLETRFVDLVYEPVIDDDGRIVGVFTQGHDVTEAVHAEERVRTSDERFRVFAQCMPSHVWSSRPDGYVEWFNDRTYAYTGYKAGTLYGNEWAQTVHPDDRTRAVAAWAHAVATGEPYRIQFRIRRADGAYRSFLIRADPVHGNGGCIEHWVGIDTDVDDEKRLGAELVSLNATLEQQVSDRTRELMMSEAALRQAQKMEAMGQLTGGVAHDFNNLLTPIIGSLDMLVRRGVGTEREQRLINGALQSADRAKTLVQRLLAFARRQPLQAVPVDLAALIDGMAALIGSTVGPRIDVQVKLATDLPPASADANQLEMAILNLGVNARDAMPDGGTLTIAAAPESVVVGHRSGLQLGHYVRLSVADTGSGMDEVTQARAVEPFFSTKGIGKGTGLGLSMVHGLVSQLGGGLTIVSEPGRGTEVELWLPIGFAEDSKTDTSVAPRPIVAQGRVLLVDDEKLVRLATADMLSDLGYDVVEAKSAEQALSLIAGGLVFDLMATDHLMSGMNGVELARHIRVEQPTVPILIVSGYAEAEGIASDLPRLTKPFRTAELALCIAALV